MKTGDLILMAAMAVFFCSPKWVPHVNRHLPAWWHRLSYTTRTRITTAVCILGFVVFAVYGPETSDGCGDCWGRGP